MLEFGIRSQIDALIHEVRRYDKILKFIPLCVISIYGKYFMKRKYMKFYSTLTHGATDIFFL